MPLVSMRQLLDHAADNGYGIPAFNVNNLEQVQAVMSAADEVGAPVILQASAGARKYAGEPFIKHLILAAVESYPKVPLVMHGSSSVPQELLAQIREYGGNMKETYGVPVSEIQEAIKFGVRKINIDTDIRLAMTGAIRKFFVQNPEKFDPREYLKPAREAAKAICRQRYLEFGCEGQAGKIKAQSLVQVAERYARGELAQTVV